MAPSSRCARIHQLLRIVVTALSPHVQTGVLANQIETNESVHHSNLQPPMGRHPASLGLFVERGMVEDWHCGRGKSSMLCARLASFDGRLG